MCMFSRPVEHVSATRIFARSLEDDRQVLVYSMQLAAREPLAMVLAIPVPPGSSEDAVEMIDLSGYPDFFEDLKRAFPDSVLFAPQPKSRGWFGGPKKPLEVQQVGAFVASFVPSPADFTRLDPRFRLDPRVLANLPGYADWGFVVFQLDVRKRAEVHPMAFRFPRRDAGSIFYPTVHVHDGTVPPMAQFDHHLFGQLPPIVAALLPHGWAPSLVSLGERVDRARARGVIDPDAGGHGALIVETAPNRDLYFRAPPGVALSDLTGSSDTYAYRVRAAYHYEASSHPTYPRWRDVSAHQLPALCRGLRDGLATLTRTHRAAWRLAPLVANMRPHFMNGGQLWRGTSHMDGGSQLTPGPGLVRFTPFSQLVEQQDITLGFAEIPSVEEAAQINRVLSAMLDESIAA